MTINLRGKKLCWTLAIILAAGPLTAAEPTTKPAPGRIRLTISKKTTYILGPVNKDGTVNYAAYLNAKHSEGVTKENNAAIPLIEILGAVLLKEDTDGKICKALKIKPPAKGKEYFISLQDYLKKTLSAKDANAWMDRDHGPTMSCPKPWSAERYPVAAKWLKTNDGVLIATLVAMKRTECYIPAISPDPDNSVMKILRPSILPYMHLSYALVARAMLRLDSGDTYGAWADLMATRRLARRIGAGMWLPEGLIALAIESRACAACCALAGDRRLTRAEAGAFLSDMQRLSPPPELVKMFDQSERFLLLDGVMTLARVTNRNDAGFRKWDEMLMIINPWFDSFVSAAGKKTFKARTEAFAAYNSGQEERESQAVKLRSLNQLLWKHVNPPDADKNKKAMARLMSALLGDDLVPQPMGICSRAFELRDRAAAHGDLSVVAMALAAYRAEKKAYPDKLSQLAPDYLKKVPDDLFIDEPFGYEKTGKGYLLYSVGENMKYDGPKKDDDDKIDDIVVRVE